MKKFTIFQTQEKNVQVVTPFEAKKKKQSQKKVTSKKKVLKVEEGETYGDEENKKKLEELRCEGYCSSWGDGAKICQEYKKNKVRF